MALIAIASDKGAPGVTTAALALAAVWPRPVLLAECDPAGGDLVYRFPAAGGGHLDPRRGVLSLAVIARRGMAPHQVWEHAQKLHGGLDVLAGVTNAEQGAGLSLLWGPIGKVLASLPQADVIADCGRLGADGPLYDLLAEATTVVLVSRVQVADVIRLRDRSTAFAAAAQSRGRRGFGVGVVVVADHKKLRACLGEVQQVLAQANAPAAVLGGIAHDTKGADLLNGEWGGSLDRTLLIKTAREVAQHLVHALPPIGSPAAADPAAANPAAAADPAAAANPAAADPAGGSAAVPSPAGNRHSATVSSYAAPAAASHDDPRPAQSGSSYGAPRSAALSYFGPAPASPSHARPGITEAQSLAPSSLPGSHEAPGSSQASRPAAEVLAGAPVTEIPDAGTSATGVAAGRRGSPSGPRTAFTRVLGSRSGRHQADPGQSDRTSGPPAGASSAAAMPDQAPDPVTAQAAYVSAPVTSAPATPAPVQPANAPVQPTYPQATNPQATNPQAPYPQAPYPQATSPQAPYPQATYAQPANPHAASTHAASANAAGADPGRPAARHAQQAARPMSDSPDYSRIPMSPLTAGDPGFLAGGYQASDFQASDFQASDFQASDFQASDFQGGYPGRRAPEPLEVDPTAAPTADPTAAPTAAPADRPDSPRQDSPRQDPPRQDPPRQDSPRQDDPGWDTTEWNTSPGPMGSRRPGRG